MENCIACCESCFEKKHGKQTMMACDMLHVKVLICWRHETWRDHLEASTGEFFISNLHAYHVRWTWFGIHLEPMVRGPNVSGVVPLKYCAPARAEWPLC